MINNEMVKFSHSKSQKKIYHKSTWDIEWNWLELKRRPDRNCCFNVFWSERFVVFIDTIYLHSYWCDSVCCVGSILCWYPWLHRKDCPVTIILSKMCVLDFVVCCTSKPSCYLKKATALFKIVMVFWLSLIFFILNYTL